MFLNLRVPIDVVMLMGVWHFYVLVQSATYGNPPLTDPEDFELMKMELWAIEL